MFKVHLSLLHWRVASTAVGSDPLRVRHELARRRGAWAGFLTLALLPLSAACRSTGGEATLQPSEVQELSPAPLVKELVRIKDEELATGFFHRVKQFQSHKSGPGLRVWEGEAELSCTVDRFAGTTDTQCYMVSASSLPGQRDYVFNFGDVYAEVLSDALRLEQVDLGDIKSKQYIGKIQLRATAREFVLGTIN